MSNVAHNPTQQVLEKAYEWHLTLERGDATVEQQLAFRTWVESDPSHAVAYAQAADSWEAFGAMTREQLSEDVSAAVAVASGIPGMEGLPENRRRGRFVLTLATAATLIFAVAISSFRWSETQDQLDAGPRDYQVPQRFGA